MKIVLDIDEKKYGIVNIKDLEKSVELLHEYKLYRLVRIKSAKKLLLQLYDIIQREAFRCPQSSDAQRLAQELFLNLNKLNDIFRFKANENR